MMMMQQQTTINVTHFQLSSHFFPSNPQSGLSAGIDPLFHRMVLFSMYSNVWINGFN